MSQSGGSQRPRIVLKLGTSVLTGGTNHLHRPTMVEIVRQCSELYQDGCELLLCSSGAQAAGRERLQYGRPRTIAEKQMLAAVGQSRLMYTWEQLFDLYGIFVGQVLLTRADFETRNRFLNARDTLEALLQQRIIPIINENDAVTTEEIRVGDNDNLSARTAVLAEAELLILLTDQAGLYTADPRQDLGATLIQEVTEIDDHIRRLAGDSGSGLGTGGMITKLQAADIARRAGTAVVIASGREKNVILRLVRGREAIGTRFPPLENPLKNRKRWILAGSKPAGSVTINLPAAAVLTGQKGRSLLPAGIVEVGGDFDRGEPITILSENGEELGRGISRYPSQDLFRIMGRQSEEIESILGYAYGPVAIHRNDMVLLVEPGSPAGSI